MCSIWVSIGFEPPRDALDAARHRGPDGSGAVRFDTPSGPLTFAHHRLSIYDLSAAGAQPMHGRDERYTIVFNGAIYNFRTLRAELEAIGHRFATQSDTEVLLRLWEEEGAACLPRLNGMFAFAIYDARERTLTLARDRFGEKPLHYALWRQDGRTCLAAASELGQLLRAHDGLAELNRTVAGNFVNFGATDWTDETFVAGVRRLPAGHVTVIDTARLPEPGSPLPARAWWTPPASDSALAGPQAAARLLRPALEDAVGMRMAADVPVGFCLSGGLDSSAIVALAARRPERTRLVCVTALFDEVTPSGASLSERPYVDALARSVDIERVSVTPSDADIADALASVIAVQGEPFASSSIIAQWLVFRAARQAGLTVMLDGQGADELMAGYPGMAGHHLADLVMSGRVARALAEIRALSAGESDFTGRGLVRACYSAVLPERVRRLIARAKGSWPPRPWPARTGLPPLGAARGGERLGQLVTAMVASVSLPALLRYEDRNAMAFGIETRLPFLDSQVSDIALRAPGTAKIADGETKRLLRAAMEGVVPGEILRRRRKLGFSSPEQRWLAGPLREPALHALNVLPERTGGFIDAGELDGLAERTATDPAIANLVFRLMSLERWLESCRVSA